MFKLNFLLVLIIFSQSVIGQQYTVSGYAEDMVTGERIIGAYVIDSISNKVVQTNNYGYYCLKGLKGKLALKAAFSGYKSGSINITLTKDTFITFKINQVSELEEVVVKSELYGRRAKSPLGLITIPVKQLTLVPSLGETDLLKSIQSQPGIKGGIEGSAGIYVRGGGSGENLFLLDDVPIYNVSHLYGFFSAFNSSAVKDIKLLKGSFPARYGGRTSSVIDVRSLEGNNKSIIGEVSVGFVSSRFTIDGPLFNDKTTFMLSGRRSYFDLYASSLKKTGLLDKGFPDYYFYDLNMRITHTLSNKDKLYLNFYKGKDNNNTINETSLTNVDVETLSARREENSGWGNIISSLRWNHTFENSLFVNTTLAYSGYDYFSKTLSNSSVLKLLENKQIDKKYKAVYSSNIADITLKTDFDYTLTKHKLSFGAGNIWHIYHPGENILSMDDQEIKQKLDTSFVNAVINANEPFIYIDDEYNVSQKLKINAGLRFSGLLSSREQDFNFEPRLSANYALSHSFVLKAGYSRMVQYLHLLSSSGVSMPTDLWVPALKSLKPLTSDQIDAGVSYEFNEMTIFNIEIYRKWLNNSYDFKNGASLMTDFSPWYEKTTQGKGFSEGIEASVDKQQGRLKWCINYTFSKANRSFAQLNNGISFPFKYDRRHDFNISTSYQLSKKLDVSAVWVYGTGYPISLPVEMYDPIMFTEMSVVYYPSRNNFSLPDYHRLDLGIHYNTSNKLGEQTISLDIFNAYNKKNPVSIYYAYCSFNYTYLLPIIPTITYTLRLK